MVRDTAEYYKIASYTEIDFWEYFRRYTGFKMRWKIYKHIIVTMNTIIMDMIFEGKEFITPFGLGRFKCFKWKPVIGKHRASINVALSSKYKKTIYNLRESTNGYMPELVWDRRGASSIPKAYYKFIISPASRKKMLNMFNENKVDYPVNKPRWKS